MRSPVELFEKIRRDRRFDDLSIRELADRHGVHRRTVRQALDDAVSAGWGTRITDRSRRGLGGDTPWGYSVLLVDIARRTSDRLGGR